MYILNMFSKINGVILQCCRWWVAHLGYAPASDYIVVMVHMANFHLLNYHVRTMIYPFPMACHYLWLGDILLHIDYRVHSAAHGIICVATSPVIGRNKVIRYSFLPLASWVSHVTWIGLCVQSTGTYLCVKFN